MRNCRLRSCGVCRSTFLLPWRSPRPLLLTKPWRIEGRRLVFSPESGILPRERRDSPGRRKAGRQRAKLRVLGESSASERNAPQVPGAFGAAGESGSGRGKIRRRAGRPDGLWGSSAPRGNPRRSVGRLDGEWESPTGRWDLPQRARVFDEPFRASPSRRKIRRGAGRPDSGREDGTSRRNLPHRAGIFPEPRESPARRFQVPRAAGKLRRPSRGSTRRGPETQGAPGLREGTSSPRAGAGNERRAPRVIPPCRRAGERGTLKTEPNLGVDRGGTLRYSPLPFGAPAGKAGIKRRPRGLTRERRGGKLPNP